MISVCQIKFVLFVRFVFKHQEQRIREISEIRVPKNIRVQVCKKIFVLFAFYVKIQIF